MARTTSSRSSSTRKSTAAKSRPAAKKKKKKTAAPAKAAPAAQSPSPQAKAAATRKKNAQKALKRANTVRSKRARLRKQVEAGKKDPMVLLRDLPKELHTLQVQDFLLWIPGVGAENVRKITRGVVLNPAMELQTLGSHTIERLANRIMRRTPGEQAEGLRAA